MIPFQMIEPERLAKYPAKTIRQVVALYSYVLFTAGAICGTLAVWLRDIFIIWALK